MKRFLFVSIASMFLFLSVDAAYINSRSTEPHQMTSTPTLEQLMKMSPKEFEKATGRKMNFIQKQLTRPQ